MDVLKTMKIKINGMDELKKFAFSVAQFESDIDIIKGRIRYDAKSIMGVIAIDTSQGVVVEIKSDDEDEIVKFMNSMEAFRYE